MPKPDDRDGARMPEPDARRLGPSSFSNSVAAARGMIPGALSEVPILYQCNLSISDIPIISASPCSVGPVVPMVYDLPAPD